MPKLIHQTTVNIEWTDINKRIRHPAPVREHDRTPGWHLSGVLKYIAIECNMLELKQVSAEDVDVFPLRMVLGMAFEEFIVGFYPDMVWQPGELCRDDVWGTPDGITYEDSGAILHEFKHTHKSYRKHVEVGGGNSIVDQWMWMQQGSGYINQLREGGLDVNQAWFHICYVNGRYEYHKGGHPTYIKYLVEYSEEELERNWNMVLQYRDRVEKEG
jgi:hypothetical protein